MGLQLFFRIMMIPNKNVCVFFFCLSRANIDEVETDVVDIEAKLDKAREITATVRSNMLAFDINTLMLIYLRMY